MQLAPKSIYNIDGVFHWLKEEIESEPYSDLISWRESDTVGKTRMPRSFFPSPLVDE